MSMRKHPITYLALFVFLGGTAYAASHAADQPSTNRIIPPLGSVSQANPQASIPGYHCPPGGRCPPPFIARLAAVHFSLNAPTDVLAFGSTTLPKGNGRILIWLADEHREAPGLGHRTGQTINTSAVLSLSAGDHTVDLLARRTGNGKTFSATHNEVIVIAAARLLGGAAPVKAP